MVSSLTSTKASLSNLSSSSSSSSITETARLKAMEAKKIRTIYAETIASGFQMIDDIIDVWDLPPNTRTEEFEKTLASSSRLELDLAYLTCCIKGQLARTAATCAIKSKLRREVGLRDLTRDAVVFRLGYGGCQEFSHELAAKLHLAGIPNCHTFELERPNDVTINHSIAICGSGFAYEGAKEPKKKKDAKVSALTLLSRCTSGYVVDKFTNGRIPLQCIAEDSHLVKYVKDQGITHLEKRYSCAAIDTEIRKSYKEADIVYPLAKKIFEKMLDLKVRWGWGKDQIQIDNFQVALRWLSYHEVRSALIQMFPGYAWKVTVKEAEKEGEQAVIKFFFYGAEEDHKLITACFSPHGISARFQTMFGRQIITLIDLTRASIEPIIQESSNRLKSSLVATEAPSLDAIQDILAAYLKL